MRLILFTAVLVVLPLAARAGGCREKHEGCLENCHIDYGMDPARVELIACVQHCDDRHLDCRKARQEEDSRALKPKPVPKGRKGEPGPDTLPATVEPDPAVQPVPVEPDQGQLKSALEELAAQGDGGVTKPYEKPSSANEEAPVPKKVSPQDKDEKKDAAARPVVRPK
jgi:hypothetical protein